MRLLLKDDVVVNIIEAAAGYQAPAGFQSLAYVDGVSIGWRRDGTAWLPPGPVEDLHVYAARRRWEIIEAHRLQLGPFSVPTDTVTQNVLTAGYAKASANPAYAIQDWKVAAGVYVTLDAATIVMIADAVEAYVQSMFSANLVADEAIEAGTATTTAQVDAILGV